VIDLRYASIEHLKVHSRCKQQRIWAKTVHLAPSGTVATISHCKLKTCQTVKEMKLSWGKVKHELYNARDATLMLAVIAGFAAWIITQLLRAVLG
jgi:hypothetical protein